MKRYVWGVLALVALLSAPAYAQFAKVADAVDYRQSVFVVMSHQFGLISAALKGERPYAAPEIASSAALVAELAKLPWEAFPPNSTADSHAKPEIWKDTAKFKDLQDKLIAQTDKLAAVAKDGDQAAVKSAFGDVGKTCKDCHDAFRSKH